MTYADPRFSTPRALRASAGLTALAVALLTSGAAVEVMGNLLIPSANGSGSAPHVTPAAHPPNRPTPTPSACVPTLTSPSCLPTTMPTAHGWDGPGAAQDRARAPDLPH